MLLNSHILEHIKDVITFVGRTFPCALKEHELGGSTQIKTKEQMVISKLFNKSFCSVCSDYICQSVF